jgi:Tol biopolymer transport system component
MIGENIGHYEVTEKLGEGGMGVVYRATDTKLNRDVAIKLLPQQLATDHERMERFRREAQVLAQLNHPGIAGIYGVEDAGENLSLVMELAEGQTLEERLESGPLPLDEALPVAKQIAEALEAAHEKGIIHRDLKPANIKVAPDGSVKILDFGLAKALEGDPASHVESNHSPTLTLAATQAGIILGTAAYMSPEQARGRTVDKRADIWSFGVVLYEMLTGLRLFSRETVSDSLAAVLMVDIDFSTLSADTPPSIQRLLRRCLERSPKNRLQAIGEARIAINEQLADPAGASILMEAPATPALPPTPRRLPWLAAGILAIALFASVAALWQATRPVERPLRQFGVDLGADASLPTNRGGAAILSPDGESMAFISVGADGVSRLYFRRFSQPDPVELTGTDDARNPFFSPDGMAIGFFTDGKLKKIAVQGGVPVTLCDAPDDRGGSWSKEGWIVFGMRRSGLLRVAAAGGTPEALTELNEHAREQSHRWPQVLPQGNAVLFTLGINGQGSYDEAAVAALSLETGERKTLHLGGTYGRYLPSGHLVYSHQGTLFVAPMDPDRLELLGPPAPAIQSVATNSGNGGAQFDFSGDGTLMFVVGALADERRRYINWLDATAETKPLLEEAGRYLQPRFSPSGGHLALAAHVNGNWDIWVYELERNTMSRLTFDPGIDSSPVWSPDGRNITFRSDRGGEGASIYVVRADGAGEVQKLVEDDSDPYPSSYSADGRWLTFIERGSETGIDIWTVPLEGSGTEPRRAGNPEVYLSTPSDETEPSFSPDGRWLAYASDESGSWEIYVRPFPGPGGKWQISNGGGSFPRWSPNRQELFYRGPNSQIMVTGYSATGDSFQPGRPRPWSETQVLNLGSYSTFDLFPDGARFGVMTPAQGPGERGAVHHVTILQNFFDELNRIAPPNGGSAR